MNHSFLDRLYSPQYKRLFFYILGLFIVFLAGNGAYFSPRSLAEDLPQLKQIKLTDKLVRGFIAAQKDLEPLSGQLMGEAEDHNKALRSQMEQIAIKHGFADLQELQTVGGNISLILYGLDRKTGTYTESVDKMKIELEGLKTDTSIPEEDKKFAIDSLNQDIARAQPLQFKENVDIVKKYQSELDALIFEGEGESLPADDNSTDILEDQD